MVIPKGTPTPAAKAARRRASETIPGISQMIGKKPSAPAAKADQAAATARAANRNLAGCGNQEQVNFQIGVGISAFYPLIDHEQMTQQLL